MFATKVGILIVALKSLIVAQAAFVCNDRHVLETTQLTTPGSGRAVTVEKFNCSNSFPTGELASDIPAGTGTATQVSERAASQCTTSTCVCGVPCFFQGCGPVSEPIHGSDCTELGDTLMSNPGTFTITPPVGVAFILETCTYSFLGPSIPTEYCFDDMGAAALELFAVCGPTQQGSCGGSSGSTEFFINQISL
ncbi:hypothetical protein CVT26_014229 [Gymnopilus dilepis]|uniref:Ubiquitin 3 binding protein But2 C-terminal domain-containing protein n=1 Tax=Gymnopilus dilepis TaxID=231916 RepID=A0A409VXG4_9AGAR|nr:hypothetical protein CVT26_014229 [Gymnopilus dilepis]